MQYLVLANAKQYPQLTANIGNIALLRLLASLNIIDHDLAEKVVLTYREFRHTQHLLKLQGALQLIVEASSVTTYADAVAMLWRQVFV